MEQSVVTAFALFVATMTGTPGPGNLTFMALGSATGYTKTFPVILACMAGNIIVSMCVAFGLGQVMAEGGLIVSIFKGLSIAYMSYLAYKIASMSVQPKGQATQPSYLSGFMIHPLSPKTWAMNLVAFSTFFAGNGLSVMENAAYLTLGFILGGFISHSLWALAGVSILKVLGDGIALRATTVFLAVTMLAATVWSLLLDTGAA
ncbi:LysE family translocator [Flexibacterium corallicola]|uniref:LysE family translocator n=1 Tax=Flexibacterium corallicola TaxID=3037259 RepID=UPI00286F5666|nr:LysE family transporter [Pseudovibrio sp. M1P-2-3]